MNFKINNCCLIIAAIFFISNYSNAQSQKSFNKLIKSSNHYLEIYSSLSAYGDEYIDLKNYNISKTDLKEFKLEYDIDSYVFKTKDSVESFSFITFIQDKVISDIGNLICHSQFQNNNIDSLLNEEIAIVKSPDNKLYNFSLDEKTGGTYRSRISIMYYSELNMDSIYKQNKKIESLPSPFFVLESDGFYRIDTINSEEGVKYILFAYVRGCSYCFGNSIRLVQYSNGGFITNFLYTTSSRSWEETISYDRVKRLIKIEYQTDDLTLECDCINEAEDNYESDYSELEEDFKFRNCKCEFKFNGKTFVLTKECMEVIETKIEE